MQSMELLMCYLLGAVPLSVIASNIILKKDLRGIGSGNIGASNAYRAGGAMFAFAIALIDISKGFVAVEFILPGTSLAVLAVCLGQMFSPMLKFSGGKGVATYIGTLIAQDLWLGMMLMIYWMLLTKITKLPFIASVFLIAVSLFLLPADIYIWLTVVIILIKHKDNMIDAYKRLRGIV